MFKPVTVWLCLQLMFHDVDYDGTHNYLVVQPQTNNTSEWMVAFNSPSDVKWKDGCYEMRGECDLGVKALDNPHPDDHMSWGYPRKAPICNAFSIEGRGFKWIESTK